MSRAEQGLYIHRLTLYVCDYLGFCSTPETFGWDMDMNTTDGTQQPANFSTLPDVTWINILRRLSLSDRGHVAATCRSLNQAFNHPSLWHRVHIMLLGDLNRFRNTSCPVIMGTSYVCMIQRFGRYFQDLSLTLSGFVKVIPDDCRAVLESLARNCRLETLTLEVGGVVTKTDLFTQQPRTVDLGAIANFVRQAFRLKSFTLRAWPNYPGRRAVNLLQSLRENPKLDGLEKLNLYWIAASADTWATLNALLPSPEEVILTARRFTNLRTLCLRSTMLHTDLLLELASSTHTPLQRLGVLVTYSAHNPDQQLPEITSQAWLSLRRRSPHLSVDVTLVTRVPYVELAGFLLPEVPLTAVSFMKYSRCGTLDVISLTDKFHGSLRKFVDYTEEGGVDEQLVAMVSQCKGMDILIYNGRIHSDTVLQLSGIRGKDWYEFKANLQHVETKPKLEDGDEDCVIRTTETGECLVSAMADQESEEEHDRRLLDLFLKVSAVLEQKWLPLGKDSVSQLKGQTVVVSPTVMAAEAGHP